MRHIKYFETRSERNAAQLYTPYLIYTKETDELEIMDVQPVEAATNPEFMALCYSKGWSEREDYMTADECAAVTNQQFYGSTSNSDFVPIKSLEELKYFTGLTTLQPSGLWDNTNIEVIHYPNSIVDCYEYRATTVLNKMSKLRKVTFPDNMPRFWDINVPAHGKTLIANCPLLKNLDVSNTAWTTDWGYRVIQSTPLKTLSLPKTMSSCASNWCFNVQSKLEWMRLFNPTPVANFAQDEFIGSTTRFYVPNDSVNTYKATTNFSSHADYIFPMSQWATDLQNGVIVEY